MALVRMRVTAQRTVIGGRYRLGDRIGSGAAGVVWQAWDVRLGRTVAVKQLPIPPGLAGTDTRRAHADAAREGRIAARLQHPAVAAMLDMVVEDGSSWLVMEYAPGRSLLAALEHRPLPPVEVARIGAELADALAAAHAVGVVHCDVKPANVLIGGDGTVKLADFGIARAVRGENVTGPGVLSGTPLFMAPEVARGSWPDGASDVFSLAATLYAAVEGTGPYGAMDHDDPLSMVRRVAETDPRPPRRAGPLTGVLTGLLVPDPAARPTAAATRDLLRSIAAPLTAPVAMAPSAAPALSATTRRDVCRTPRRRRALTALSTVGVVGVGAVAGSFGGGSVMALLTASAPAPFDQIAILGGGSGSGGTATSAAPGAFDDLGTDDLAGPGAVPAVGAPIVPDDDPSASSGTGATAVTASSPRTSTSDAASTSVGHPVLVSAPGEPLPIAAGVIEDVPIAGPVLGGALSGTVSTVDGLLPVDLGSDDGLLGLPVDLGSDDGLLGLPVDLGSDDGVLGLPVDLGSDDGVLGLPVDLGSDDGLLGLPVDLGSDDGPLGLPVDLGSGDGPLGLPVDLPLGGGSGNSDDGASGSGSGSSGLLGLPVDLPGGLLGGSSGSAPAPATRTRATPARARPAPAPRTPTRRRDRAAPSGPCSPAPRSRCRSSRSPARVRRRTRTRTRTRTPPTATPRRGHGPPTTTPGPRAPTGPTTARRRASRPAPRTSVRRRAPTR